MPRPTQERDAAGPAPTVAGAPSAGARSPDARTRGAPASRARFRGYGVLGLPFTLGDVLALRRFDSASVGRAYTAVWHRDPEGLWTIYTDVPPAHGCARYFAVGRTRARRAEIHIEWTDRDRAAITIPEYQLDWAIRLGRSPATRALNGATGLIPGPLLGTRTVLDALAPLRGPAPDCRPAPPRRRHARRTAVQDAPLPHVPHHGGRGHGGRPGPRAHRPARAARPPG